MTLLVIGSTAFGVTISGLAYLCTAPQISIVNDTEENETAEVEQSIDKWCGFWSVVAGVGAGRALYCFAESSTVSIGLPAALIGLGLTIASKFAECCSNQSNGAQTISLSASRRRSLPVISYGSV